MSNTENQGKEASSCTTSEAFYRFLFEEASDGIFISDLQGHYIAANPRATEITGYSCEELTKMSVFDLVPQEDLDRDPIKITSMPVGSTMLKERRIRKKDGTIISIEVNARVLSDGISATVRDITARKHDEEQLVSKTQAIESSINGIAFADMQGNITFVNRAFVCMWGYDDENEMLHHHASNFLESDKQIDQAMSTLQGQGIYIGELAAKKKNGEKFIVHLTSTLLRDKIGRPIGMMGSFIDTTKRRQMEEALRESEKRLAADLEAMTMLQKIGALFVGKNSMQEVLNEVVVAMQAITGADLVNIQLLDLQSGKFTIVAQRGFEKKEIDPQHCINNLQGACSLALDQCKCIIIEDILENSLLKDMPRALEHHIAAGIRSIQCIPLLSRSGTRLGVLSIHYFTPHKVDDRIQHLLDLLTRQTADIIERSQTEEALRQEMTRSQQYLDTARVIMVALNLEGDVVLLNQYGRDILGYDNEHILGKNWIEKCIPEASREQIKKVFLRVANGNINIDEYVENYIVTQSGEQRLIAWHNSILKDNQGKIIGTLSSGQDITNQKRVDEERTHLQSQLFQARKMEAIGRLAGGVAHDFNNMLGVILGYAELVMQQLGPWDANYGKILEIKNAAQRSAELTRQLLAFARRQTIAPKVLNLNEAVGGMLKMLLRLIGENINLIWIPGHDLKPVKIDPFQIDQILANLCANARDAISGIGRITIETQNATFDKIYCMDHPGIVPGEYIMLAVSDTGCGMEKDIIEHLFEPFFTTKGVGQGIGLGLATIYGIVKQNEGFINVYSEIGHGTTFKIYLPQYNSGTTSLSIPIPTSPSTAQGRETVLLVEDEPAILKLGKRMLEGLGYEVLTASIPSEAMRLAKGHTGTIHLLMTDVVMPEMNGKDLAQKLLESFPNLKVLFMSGYTANVIAHHGVLDENVHFIQKPFSLQELGTKIKEALEAK